MPLERGIHYDPPAKRLQGLVDFGAGWYDADEVLAAGEALLFVAVGFQGQWIIPLGYFLLDTLRGDVQAQLLRHCILKLYSIGVRVMSVTSDATAPNIDTARRLGVAVDGLSVKSTFFHPATSSLEIAYYFDPSHLLSLILNKLQADGSLWMNGKTVCWDYLWHLGALQEEEVLQAASQAGGIGLHKQRVWGNGTTQLFSEGTAQALDFAAGLGLPQFQGQEATAHFIRLLSAVFDACNSWNIHGKGSKAPLSLTNADAFNSLCNEYENLLRKLRTVTGELLWLSKHRWGSLGFLVNLRSFQWVVQTQLQEEDNAIAHLLPCWWTLDPLEWCRGAIRQACGHKGVATAWAFQHAYRHVLSRILSESGLDLPNLLDISLCRRTSLQLQASWPLRDRQIWQSPPCASLPKGTNNIVTASTLLVELEEDLVTYISSVVVGKLLPLLHCAECRAALLIPCRIVPAGNTVMCVESKGQKFLPARSVWRVIRRAKQVIGLSSRSVSDSSHGEYSALELAILADVSEEPDLFSPLASHVFESNTLVSNHYVVLLQKLVRTFLDLCFGAEQVRQPIPLIQKQSCLKGIYSEQITGCASHPAGSWHQQRRELQGWYKIL